MRSSVCNLTWTSITVVCRVGTYGVCVETSIDWIEDVLWWCKVSVCRSLAVHGSDNKMFMIGAADSGGRAV
jgi:hypothetical protein